MYTVLNVGYISRQQQGWGRTGGRRCSGKSGKQKSYTHSAGSSAAILGTRKEGPGLPFSTYLFCVELFPASLGLFA